MTKRPSSCRHSRFWFLGAYWAWCPECGGIRKLKYEDDSLVFAWKRWIIPIGRDVQQKQEKLMKLTDNLLDKRYTLDTEEIVNQG